MLAARRSKLTEACKGFFQQRSRPLVRSLILEDVTVPDECAGEADRVPDPMGQNARFLGVHACRLETLLRVLVDAEHVECRDPRVRSDEVSRWSGRHRQ